MVDVLITYCEEGLGLLLDTVRAACNLDYPHERFRVVVLDDSDSVSKAIAELGRQYPNLFYSVRDIQEKIFECKVVNLNHGSNI